MEASNDEILPALWLDGLTNDQKIRIELLLEEMIATGTGRQTMRNIVKRARDKEIRFAAHPPCLPEEVSSLLKSAQFDSDRGEITIAGRDWILMRGATLRALIERVMRLPGREGMTILSDAGSIQAKNSQKQS
jgi:hypothetical protein